MPVSPMCQMGAIWYIVWEQIGWALFKAVGMRFVTILAGSDIEYIVRTK